mgnify:CR=1 FL=1
MNQDVIKWLKSHVRKAVECSLGLESEELIIRADNIEGGIHHIKAWIKLADRTNTVTSHMKEDGSYNNSQIVD